LPKSLAAAMTLAGGTSVGHVPFQRRWFLGGTQTIRGQSPDTLQSGNAFWMSRLEFGVDRSPYRIMLFGDLGWVGNRSEVADLVRPMSGAGIGLSMLDGLVRFDVARGFYPQRQTRVAAYLQARF
jgi:hemolysin activation/secretion protein